MSTVVTSWAAENEDGKKSTGNTDHREMAFMVTDLPHQGYQRGNKSSETIQKQNDL